jgi:hypothetical protein
MRLRQLLRHLRAQDGLTLVMAVGILGVLTLSGTTLVYYSSANARSAVYSDDNSSAYDLAEAGINEMMAVLAKPDNNALNKRLLGLQPDGSITHTVHEYDDGTVEWWGTLDEASATWSLTSIGEIANKSGSAPIKRTLKAKVPVTPTTTQPLNNPAWNYIYSTQVTGGECDMTLDNTVELRTRVYVAGNLCLKQSAKINGGANVTLVVHGKVTQYQTQNRMGQPTGTGYGPLAEAHVAGGCKWSSNTLHNPCQQGYGASGFDELWAGTITNTPQPLSQPVADWDAWYLNASPGPYYPCSLVNTGPTPTFDNDQGTNPDATKRNKSVTGTFNLTPSSSYSCKTAGGELTWNATSKVLTVSGTIFIDGNVKAEPATANQLIQYDGQASIYVSGTVLLKNVKLCGGVSGTSCDFASWNPNTEMLTFVADGSGGQTDVPTGVSIELKSAQFQGALYATNKVQLDTSSKVDGPMVGTEVVLGQSIETDDFETIVVAPAGMPGNPAVYAQPNSPQLYSG